MEQTNVKVIQSDLDERQYRYLELDNKMKVLLICDAEAETSGVSLEVGVGSYSDPDELNGLAHFCEHMLFLGTEKFPSESEYEDYLNTHGGFSNAYTDTEATNYHFEVQSPHLEGALDRFSGFFTCPLFTASATSREVNAIHSEHSKNLQNDYWRKRQLLRSSASKKHPFHKFSTGSLETLEVHADLRDQLIKFHSANYSSSIMRLCVLGSDDLDMLEKWVRQYFSDVKLFDVPREVNAWGPAFVDIPARFHVVPVKDMNQLNFFWEVPDMLHMWKTRPGSLFSHLLGHEGGGSILALLKQKGWGISLTAGCQETAPGMMYINIKVTPEGFLHLDEIVEIVFQYIQILKTSDLKTWFEENKTMSELEFAYLEKLQPADYATQLSHALLVYPADCVLTGDTVLYEWNEEYVKSVVSAFTVQNMLLLVESQSFQGTTDSVEQHYKIESVKVEISKSFVDRCENPSKNGELYLPEKNLFIPDDFSRHTPDARYISELPKAIALNQATIWYNYDSNFNLPKAYCGIYLMTPNTNKSALCYAMSNLYCELVNDALNEFTYYATMAKLYYALQSEQDGISITVNGFNCKQSVLVKKLFEFMTKFDIKEERFNIIREEAIRKCDNWEKDSPYKRITLQTRAILETNRYLPSDIRAALPTITFESLKEFARTLFETLKIEALAIGNLTNTQAETFVNEILTLTQAKPLTKENENPIMHLSLERGKHYYISKTSLSEEETNSAIDYLTYIGPYSVTTNSLLDLFVQCVNTPAYHQLRTVEQLGYIVFASKKFSSDMSFFRVLIQSDSYSCDHLEERIRLFIESFEKSLEDMPEEEFEESKEAVIIAKLEKFKSMGEQYNTWNDEIRSHRFDKWQIEAERIKDFTKQDLLDFFRTYLKSDSPTRTTFKFKLYCKKFPEPSELEKKESEIHITDIRKFQEETLKHDIYYSPSKEPRADLRH